MSVTGYLPFPTASVVPWGLAVFSGSIYCFHGNWKLEIRRRQGGESVVLLLFGSLSTVLASVFRTKDSWEGVSVRVSGWEAAARYNDQDSFFCDLRCPSM